MVIFQLPEVAGVCVKQTAEYENEILSLLIFKRKYSDTKTATKVRTIKTQGLRVVKHNENGKH